jgi:uncharacterized protein (TIGR03083 family)
MVSVSVENLAVVWASIDQLCSGLDARQWDRPTGCPGWTVKDHLSHLTDYQARALGRPAAQHEPGPEPEHLAAMPPPAISVGQRDARAVFLLRITGP